jgi:hypothetical protein
MRFSALPALIESLDLEERREGTPRRPPRDNVRAVQNMLAGALTDEEFYLDCIDKEIESNLRRTADAPRQPLFRMPDLGIKVHMFYWYPHRTIAAHEHTAWTVTAVFYNRLQVTTYDWDYAVRERKLQQKNQFEATQAKAGHIYEPCIHNPGNATDIVTTSLHIFNNADMPCLEMDGPVEGIGDTNAVLPEDPMERAATVAEWSQRQLRVMARVLSQFRSQRAMFQLGRIARNGDARTAEVVQRVRWLIRNDKSPKFGQPVDADQAVRGDTLPTLVDPIDEPARCATSSARLCA